MRIKGITLLSIAEYKQCKKNIKPIEGCWWWLRSQGYYKSFAAYVYHDGDINPYGCSIYHCRGYVRPVLIVKGAPPVGSHFKFGDVSWTMISSRLALADKPLDSMPICFPFHGRVIEDYVYETSDIKTYLDAWLKAAKKRHLQTQRTMQRCLQEIRRLRGEY